MRSNTKNGNQRFIPPFGCFPLIPVVFFQTGERPATIAEIHRWNSPTHLRHDLLPPSIVCRPCFSTSPPAPSFLPRIIFTIPLPHSFPHSPPPSRFHFPDRPLIVSARPAHTCPPNGFPRKFTAAFSALLAPLPPHTHMPQTKKEKGLLSFKSSPFRRSP